MFFLHHHRSMNWNVYVFSLKKGFSVGDELGLNESLGNLDGNKRRSISAGDALIAANSVGTVPASKIPVSQNTMLIS